MDFLTAALKRALLLLVSPDSELIGIISLSLGVSGSAVALATLFALPFASALAFKRFPLRGVVLSIMNTFMGLPPVVVGLTVYIIFSMNGPLGVLELLYTPYVMVIAQFLLALPIVTAISHSAIVGVDPAISDAARTLGATPTQRAFTIIKEARYGILSAVMAALGRVMAEVGAVLIVGGNIRGYTRVMTTTIALEADKGDFELAIALGIVLLGISLIINSVLYHLQRKGKRP
jgi:tungstate transport system permease protein